MPNDTKPQPPPAVNYALIQNGAVLHVALALEKAETGLTFEALAERYRHSLNSDLYRVKLHNKLATDTEANAWIIRRAVAFLAATGGVEVDGDTVTLLKPFEELRWRNDESLQRPKPDQHAELRDPFDRQTGIFSDNIRLALPKNDTELRESLRRFGWVKKFPALVDENGVVLVGHRRLQIAKELGIEPVIETVVLGNGDAADAERLKLALVSNLGFAAMTPKDRQRIAAHLYGSGTWTMENIAKALDVGQATITRDLKDEPDPKKQGPRGKGRPKGSTKPKPKAEPKPEPKPLHGTAADAVKSKQEVDPDYDPKDDPTGVKFATEYGHTPTMTKSERDRARQIDALQAWLKLASDASTANKALQNAELPAALAEWLTKASKRERLERWFTDLETTVTELVPEVRKLYPS